MPDFFVDTILSGSYNYNFDKFKEKINSGGGSIRRISHVDRVGGNAVNVAQALGKIGVSTTLSTISEDKYVKLLNSAFESNEKVELSVKKGKNGRTTSIEFMDKGKMANVMLSDVGDISRFNSKMIKEAAWKRISEADAVIQTNWSSNNHGSELAESVFNKTKRNCLKMIDPADIEGREKEFETTIKHLTNNGKIDVLSLNNNEASILGKITVNRKLEQDYDIKSIKDLASKLSDELSLRIDLHTPKGSVSAKGKEIDAKKAFSVKQISVTGAGDMWDAANTTGYLLKLTNQQRILLANYYASIYISKQDGIPPTLKEVISSIKKQE